MLLGLQKTFGHFYILGRSVKWYHHSGREFGTIKVNTVIIGLSYDLAITLLDIYPRDMEVSVSTETHTALFTPALLAVEKYDGGRGWVLVRVWLSQRRQPTQ